MSISELFPAKKKLSQIPITKSMATIKASKMNSENYEDRKHPCTICHKRFKAKNHLREHLALHSDKTNYKCEKCNLEFKAPGSWRGHMRKIHGFECPQCKKPFPTLTLLKQHRMSKHKNFVRRKLEDEVGMIEKVNKPNGIKSIQSKPGQKRMANLAPKKTASSTPKSIVKKILAKSRLNGSSNCTKTGKFVCKECGFRYELARSLKRHLDTAHKDTFNYKCTRCAYVTNRSDNFKYHMERHAEGNSIKCSIPSCKLEFFSIKSLRIHVNKNHPKNAKNFEEISIKKEKKDENFGYAELDEDESELLDELDPENGNEGGELDENADESFKFHNNSFLNSTEKSTRQSNVKSKKASGQIKITTCFSLNSKKEEKNEENFKEQKSLTDQENAKDQKNSNVQKNTKEKPKTGNSVIYECCECKIDFPGNTELWDHLLAVHFNKMKNNGKKS